LEVFGEESEGWIGVFIERDFGGKGFEKNGFEFGWDAWSRWI
jgi:hypothetical protein